MSPASTATREQAGGSGSPRPLASPLADLLQLSKEIVVDWQLPSDLERKN